MTDNHKGGQNKKFEPLKVYVDGSANPNPEGRMGIGVYCEGRFAITKECGIGTNNEAEFLALLAALNELRRRRVKEAVIFTDSKLVYHQVNGDWKVESETSLKLVPVIREKMAGRNYQLAWIPREQNNDADMLSAYASGAIRMPATLSARYKPWLVASEER